MDESRRGYSAPTAALSFAAFSKDLLLLISKGLDHGLSKGLDHGLSNEYGNYVRSFYAPGCFDVMICISQKFNQGVLVA